MFLQAILFWRKIFKEIAQEQAQIIPTHGCWFPCAANEAFQISAPTAVAPGIGASRTEAVVLLDYSSMKWRNAYCSLLT